MYELNYSNRKSYNSKMLLWKLAVSWNPLDPIRRWSFRTVILAFVDKKQFAVLRPIYLSKLAEQFVNWSVIVMLNFWGQWSVDSVPTVMPRCVWLWVWNYFVLQKLVTLVSLILNLGTYDREATVSEMYLAQMRGRLQCYFQIIPCHIVVINEALTLGICVYIVELPSDGNRTEAKKRHQVQRLRWGYRGWTVWSSCRQTVASSYPKRQGLNYVTSLLYVCLCRGNVSMTMMANYLHSDSLSSQWPVVWTDLFSLYLWHYTCSWF